MRLELRAHAFRRIPAQGDDVLHTGLPVILCHSEHFFLGRRDTGQMPGRTQTGFLGDATHGPVGALPCGAASPVGHGDEGRLHRLKTLHRFPQPLLHLLRFRREEFEGHGQSALTFKGLFNGSHGAIRQLVYTGFIIKPGYTLRHKDIFMSWDFCVASTFFDG